MSLQTVLDEYDKTVSAWLDQVKRELSAVQKLRAAATAGKLRDIEKLRQAARGAADESARRAEDCAALDFDTAGYLASDGDFLPELLAAAERDGVRLFERDGVIFSYPVLVRIEPELNAVRIDKAIETTLRPTALSAILKRFQAKDPKARPERFIETLFEAYEFVRAKSAEGAAYIDVPLVDVYDVLTLLPGSEKEYTLLDFARDLYFLDTSDIRETKKGFLVSLPASTATRVKRAKPIPFVDRNGQEKLYLALKFTPPES